MASTDASILEADSLRSFTPFAGRAVADYVFIENLSFQAIVGPDAWGRAGEDNIDSTLSYSKMSKDITEAIEAHKKGFPSVQAVMDLILYVVMHKNWGGLALELQVHLPKALLQASGGLKYIRAYTPQSQSFDKMPFPREKLYPHSVVEDINAACIIGVNPHERETKQQIKIQLTIEEDLTLSAPEGIKSHWQKLVKNAFESAETSSFLTAEALAASLGDELLQKWPAHKITVSVTKPMAQAFVGGSGVQVTRYKH